MPLPLLAAVGLAGSAAAGIGQTISGISTANQARKAIDGYQRQDLTNLAENLPLRTDAQEFQAQQQDSSLASILNALQQGGNFGGATGIANQALEAKQSIAAGIQTQQDRLDQLKLDEERRVRDLQESREQADLAGLGAQLRYGKQQTQQGIGALGQTFGTLATTAGLDGGNIFGSGSNINKRAVRQELNKPTLDLNAINYVPPTDDTRYA